MKVLKGTVLLLLAAVVAGVVAIFLADELARAGMLGTCFEGACGYAAIYGAFPLLWLVLFLASIVGYFAWAQGRG